MKLVVPAKGGLILACVITGVFFIFTNINAGGRGIEYIDRTLPQNKEISEKDEIKPQISATEITSSSTKPSSSSAAQTGQQTASLTGGLSNRRFLILLVMLGAFIWIWRFYKEKD